MVSVILPLVLLAVQGTLGLLFQPDPCPDERHCSCATFTIKCDNRHLTDMPAFVDTGLRYTMLDLSYNNITSVPAASFANISNIVMLDLSNNPITTVDNNAFLGLDNLQTLLLDYCHLAQVPAGLGNLHNLRTLSMSHNAGINFLPLDVMVSVSATLETLDFSNTGIREWPIAVKSLIRLKRLLSSGNQLSQLPLDAFQGTIFATLEYLDLAYNSLRAFPDAINDLRALKHLDLSFNLLGTIPPGKFTYSKHTLQTLYLVHVMFREIPQGLKDLPVLQNLYLSYNPISNVSRDVFHGRIASSLKVLHLDKTMLSDIPSDALNYLTGLTELNITWNRIQYLENYALDLPQLDTLYLDKNPLVNIKFAAFSGLPLMTKLYMRNTTLAFVPNAALARAPKLAYVDMSFNQFEALYDYGFPGMSWLKELILMGNPLKNVSANAYADLSGVSLLNLENCLLSSIPRSVQQMPSLRSLKMMGNSIECSCTNLGWVETWRANQGLISRVEGTCSNNDTLTIQNYIDGDGRSC